ncbi:prepilin peptidase [Paraliomyxa miuraensis]|uniref:prepilin peptidase n=1 Tax=Paraliomyxa miuraensis TaxID=376150 RepID=UPI002252CE07|nr:A24 family peptidase [Paraliomyxa miuraensis]MCX4243221.1 prepilin peptidase [Paraliomyxa miuraensis]
MLASTAWASPFVLRDAAGPIAGVITPVSVDPFWIEVLLSPWAGLFAFVWGTLWGSFANVVIHRVPQGLSVLRPRSRCPACETPIAGWDNIPVLSYLILRGRCRKCGEPFSLRYLMVELLSGVLAFALYMKVVHVPLVAGGGVAVVPWLMWFGFGLSLLVITYIDLDYWIIPDVIVLPMAVIGVVVAFAWPEGLGVPGVEALVAAGLGYGTFAGIRALYLRVRGIEALGLGDAKLLLMVGAFTGLPGLVWCIGAGAVQGLLVSVPLLLLGRRVANSELHEVHGDDPELGPEDADAGVTGQRVPFGPFLAVAALEFVLLRDVLEPLWAAP